LREKGQKAEIAHLLEGMLIGRGTYARESAEVIAEAKKPSRSSCD
jgi:hypothetical protein